MKNKTFILTPFEGARLCIADEAHFGDTLPPLAVKNAEERAKRYKKEKDARLSRLGLFALEVCLSELGATPCDLAVYYDENGRPSLNSDIDISISHSGDLALCLASVNDRVGVDVERIDLSERGKKKASSIPSWLFSQPERDAIGLSDTPEVEFIRLWTMREAVGKYAGVGLLRENALEYIKREGLDVTTLYISQDLKDLSEQYSAGAAYVITLCKGARK